MIDVAEPALGHAAFTLKRPRFPLSSPRRRRSIFPPHGPTTLDSRFFRGNDTAGDSTKLQPALTRLAEPPSENSEAPAASPEPSPRKGAQGRGDKATSRSGVKHLEVGNRAEPATRPMSDRAQYLK